MKTLSAILVVAACVAFPTAMRSQTARTLPAAIELQSKLLSLELPASSADLEKVGHAMANFARSYGFVTSDGPGSPLWNIQRFYVGPQDTSVVLSIFPKHVLVGLSRRPADGDAHHDLVDGLRATFAPLGFRRWVEPAE